jgi:arylformamidase
LLRKPGATSVSRPAARSREAVTGMDKVYGDYDQSALDIAYTQSAWAPSMERIIPWYGEQSAASRTRLRHIAEVPYGESQKERLDIFPTDASHAPVVIFVHGGAWTELSKADAAFAAETFVAAGIAFVALGFDRIPTVRLPEMVRQVQRAVTWVHTYAVDFGGDASNVHLIGHSSGAHLAAAALTYGSSVARFPRAVRSAFCVSGSYDLEPVALSHRGQYLNLTPQEIDELSPVRHSARLSSPVTIAYGGRESPEFQRQAQAFAAEAARVGRLDELIYDAQEDHFTLSATLADANGLLTQAILTRITSTNNKDLT